MGVLLWFLSSEVILEVCKTGATGLVKPDGFVPHTKRVNVRTLWQPETSTLLNPSSRYSLALKVLLGTVLWSGP